jgi:hypothetical protein
MKTEVYSWRLSRSLKADLDNAARRRKAPVSKVLEMAAREWLAKNSADLADDEEQARLHAQAARFFGIIKRGAQSADAKTVRKTIRKRLTERYGLA